MPIINAVNSNWLTGKVWLPISGRYSYAVFSSFSSKQISNRSAVTDIAYGFPYEKQWDVGHTYWQTDFTCPLLVTELGVNPLDPHYESTQFIYEFLQMMLSVGGYKMGDAFTAGTLKNKWDFSRTETIGSSNADYIIQKLSIDLSDSESSFSVSILSTMDIRDYFNVFGKDNLNSQEPLFDWEVYRTVSCFDVVPIDGSIGSPLGFFQANKYIFPIRTNDLTAYSSLLLDFHLTVEATTTQVPTIGIPSSRTFLGINSLKSSGNIKYIPLFFNGNSIRFQEVGANFAPAGFICDFQTIDYLSNSIRHGGKLYVSMDLNNPMFPQFLIRSRNIYIVNGKDSLTPLGPVSISEWGLTSTGGQMNTINVNYVTSPGLTTF